MNRDSPLKTEVLQKLRERKSENSHEKMDTIGDIGSGDLFMRLCPGKENVHRRRGGMEHGFPA